MRRSIAILTLFLAAFSSLAGGPAPERFPDFILEPMEFLPGEKRTLGTFIKGARDFIYCRGLEFKGPPPRDPRATIRYGNKTYADPGAWNNEILKALDRENFQKRAGIEEAVRKFQAGLRYDPLFFPYLYNLGRLYFILKLPRRALRYFRRAAFSQPMYAGVYMNLGRSYARIQEHRAAVAGFREAFRKNRFDSRPLVALGDYHLERGSRSRAAYYYQKALVKNPRDSNAKIGIARLFIQKGERVRARILLREIPTENLDGSPRGDYDRSLHYYRAVLASELRDYAASLKQFNKLLSFPRDAFFLRYSIIDIKRRRDIIKKLHDAEKSGLK